MAAVARDLVARTERDLSRRGFLALAGKVTAALGLAMAGAASMPRRVFAASCCPSPPGLCTGCPPTIGCPPTCTVSGVPTICCDTGVVGATNTIHQCQLCLCGGGGGGNCYCEYDTGNGCP